MAHCVYIISDKFHAFNNERAHNFNTFVGNCIMSPKTTCDLHVFASAIHHKSLKTDTYNNFSLIAAWTRWNVYVV